MFNHETYIQYIRDNTLYKEQLAMLAEECAELAQAALKMRRVIDPDASPTTVSTSDAENHMREEVADVLTCLLVIGDYIDGVNPYSSVEQIMSDKLERWHDRIEEANN